MGSQQARGSGVSAAWEDGAVPVPIIGAAAVRQATSDCGEPEAGAVLNADPSNRLNWHSISGNVPPTIPATAALEHLQVTTPATQAIPQQPTTPTAQQITTLTTPTTPTVQQVTAPMTQQITTPTTPTVQQVTTPLVITPTLIAPSTSATVPTMPSKATPSMPLQETTPTGLHSILKKVAFSVPEVTQQHCFEVEADNGQVSSNADHGVGHKRTRKVKKRHRHHEGHEWDRGDRGEATAVKRRRVKEGGEERSNDSLGQARNAGWFIRRKGEGEGREV